MTVMARDAFYSCDSLQALILEQDRLGDISKMVISVSRPTFKILFVPNGCEKNAKTELNER